MGLLKHNANVNREDKHGNTPLIIAAQNGKYNIVDVLVKNGAQKDHTNKKGQTAVEMAAKYKHARIVNFLNQKSGSLSNFMNSKSSSTTDSNLMPVKPPA